MGERFGSDKLRKTRGGRKAAGGGTKPRPAGARPSGAAGAAPAAPVARGASDVSWHGVVQATVAGLGYELVDAERAPRGLLQVFIDRVPGHPYPTGESESVTVDDCEVVTRQLQYALEVDGVDYARLEVSSPGLDRPLKTEADYERFTGHTVQLALKQPFMGRKNWQGVLARAEGAEPGHWSLLLAPQGSKDQAQGQVLGFELAEVREAKLVPVLDFKGRRPGVRPSEGAAPETAPAAGETDR